MARWDTLGSIVLLGLCFAGLGFILGALLSQPPPLAQSTVSEDACFARGIALFPGAVDAISISTTTQEGAWVVTLHHHHAQKLSFWLRNGDTNQAIAVKHITLY